MNPTDSTVSGPAQRVTLLGTGTPGPNPHRLQSGVLVEIGNDAALFDAGRGCVLQLARANVDLAHIGPVFITHHHADHIGDLFDVILTSALAGRTDPLSIHGPPGTHDIVRAMIEHVYARDIRSRLGEIDNQRRQGFPVDTSPTHIASVEAHDVEPGVVFSNDRWRVIADDVRHGVFPDDPDFDWRCYGYRIEAGGRVVVISGDTVPCEGIARLADGADLLVQCCQMPDSFVTTDAGRAFTETTLPTAGQAGRIAAAAGVGHLVLTHISMAVAGPDLERELRQDVTRHFAGTVTVGEDLMVFDVPMHRE